MKAASAGVVLAFFCLTGASLPGAVAAAAGKAGEVQTLKGELVDSRCWLTEAKRGADHQKCAALCMKDGIPAGLVTSDGKYYTLIVQPASLAEIMALQAEVTGTVNGDTIVPTTMKVMKNGAWVEFKLPEQMM